VWMRKKDRCLFIEYRRIRRFAKSDC
jgi:hypothetical protein